MTGNLEQPLLTVVVPVKAPDPARLARCLFSFAALPSSAEIEVLLVRSGEIPELPVMTAEHFHDLRTIESTAPGIYQACNAGIPAARGRYLLFFGHDDIALPDMETVLSLARNAPDARTMIAAGMYVQGVGNRFPSLLRQGVAFRNWGHQGLLYAADLLHTSSYDTRYPLRADHVLNMSLLADRGVRLLRSRAVVAWFSRGGYSTRVIDDPLFDGSRIRLAGEAFGIHWGLAVGATLLSLRAVRTAARLLRRVS
jgi:glycosyltransferase involved in cell wall biosynthesis